MQVKAVLLAGGLGTRLHPLTEHLPKPMVPVLGRPWLERLLADLARQRVTEAVCALRHEPEAIMERIGTGESLGLPVRYRIEPAPLGTGGAIRYAAQGIEETFLVFNADVAHQFDLKQLVDFHRRHGALVTIGLVAVEDVSGYGVVERDETGRVLRFVEKPDRSEARSPFVNAGVYVFEPAALEYIPEGREVSVERETFPALLAAGEPVYAAVLDGYWSDLGTRERYLRVHRDILAGRWPLPEVGLQPARERVWQDPTARVHPEAELVPPVWLGPRSVVESGATVGPWVVLGPGSRIGAGARVQDAVLWEGARVGPGAQLESSVLGRGASVPGGVRCWECLVAPSPATAGR